MVIASANWKAVERKVGNAVGGKRIPLSGRNNMGMVGDVKIEGLNIEVKSGRQVPKAVTDWLETIRADRERGKTPVLVMKPFRLHEEIAVLTLSDFVALFRIRQTVDGGMRDGELRDP